MFGLGAEKVHEMVGYSWHFLGELEAGGSGGEWRSFQKIWLPKPATWEKEIQQTCEWDEELETRSLLTDVLVSYYKVIVIKVRTNEPDVDQPNAGNNLKVVKYLEIQ